MLRSGNNPPSHCALCGEVGHRRQTCTSPRVPRSVNPPTPKGERHAAWYGKAPSVVEVKKRTQTERLW